MKKIISVILITILLVTLVILEQIFVDKTLDTLINKISFLDEKISTEEQIDNTETKELILSLDNYWTEKEKKLCLTINHNDLNRVGEQIKKIRVYIFENNKEDCIYELKVLAFYAESYKHVMELNLQNLL